MFFRTSKVAGLLVSQQTCRRRLIQSTAFRKTPTALNNIISGGPELIVQVKKLSSQGIELEDGLVLPAACIFLNGKVFLWDVPTSLWKGWTAEHLELFEVVVPKPEILLLGTGKSVVQPPLPIRSHLQKIGIQLDVMDTWNACSTYNLLSEEGRNVAAALLPYYPKAWTKKTE